jgi:hypothetical protein
LVAPLLAIKIKTKKNQIQRRIVIVGKYNKLPNLRPFAIHYVFLFFLFFVFLLLPISKAADKIVSLPNIKKCVVDFLA